MIFIISNNKIIKMSKDDFTKDDFVIEFYNEFHTNLSKKPIKFFEEIQEIYQHVFQNMNLLGRT